jgi:hypothetical protein
LQWFKVDEMKLLMGCFFRNSESSNRVGTDVPRSGARMGSVQTHWTLVDCAESRRATPLMLDNTLKLHEAT